MQYGLCSEQCGGIVDERISEMMFDTVQGNGINN